MNFLETLKGLPASRQLVLVAAVISVASAMTFLMRGAMKEPMSLLYSGLAMDQAGEIVGELDKRGVAYEIRNEAIFVSRSMRDQVRMSLASDGLPRQDVKGYELLDDVNGFSITSEMYNASYWRAKEGELTRTILSVPGVNSARVHIGASLRSGFGRSNAIQTASVTLSSANTISADQAEAIQYLVALAVSGLAPDDVAVIDARAGILAGPNVAKTATPGVIAGDLAATLEGKIQRLLQARLGPGNSQVSVNVDVTRELERTSAVRFDPESRVVRQRTTTDTNQSGTSSAGGLTVASNLPQGTGAGGGGSNTARNSSESVSYELNETRTDIERLPGEVKRVSVAVMLNEEALTVDGETLDVAAAIAEFEQLISSAAGLDFERGDGITVELMPFVVAPVEELLPAPSVIATMLDRHLWSGVQALLLSLVVLALGIGVIRPILLPKRNAEADALLAGPVGATGGMQDIRDDSDPFGYLRQVAQEREAETAALLQEWLNDEQKVRVNE